MRRLVSIWQGNAKIAEKKLQIEERGGVKYARYLGELKRLEQGANIWLTGKPPNMDQTPKRATIIYFQKAAELAASPEKPDSVKPEAPPEATPAESELPKTAALNESEPLQKTSLVETVAPAKDSYWDAEQLAVIEAPPDSRLLVDACPGSGKTATACARLVYLVEKARCNPCGIHFLSFTRTAVAELRERVKNLLQSKSFVGAIEISTIDSFAWRLNRGFNAEASLSSDYDRNIRQVAQMAARHPLIRDWLDGVSHLIIDEAQDIVGERAELLQALIRLLPDRAGVTIFSDDAQAIYGWSARAESLWGHLPERYREILQTDQTLPERIRSAKMGFAEKNLKTVHRAKSDRLKKIFTEVRADVLAAGSKNDWETICQKVKNLADARDDSAFKPSHLGLSRNADPPANAFAVFRYKRDVLRCLDSIPAQKAFRLRIGGIETALPAWLALCAPAGAMISESDFMANAAGLVKLLPTAGLAASWQTLLEIADCRAILDPVKLARNIGLHSLPDADLKHELGHAGPIIGTIHASKGRETDDVHLYLPAWLPKDDYAEECRVLFVAASRARRLLAIHGTISAKSWSKREDSRIWAQDSGAGKRVAFGLTPDIDSSCLAGKDVYASSEEAAACQQELRKLALDFARFPQPLPARARRLGDRYELLSANGRRLCFLASPVIADLRKILHKLPDRIDNLLIMDIISVKSAGGLHKPWDKPALLLQPRIIGYPLFAKE